MIAATLPSFVELDQPGYLALLLIAPVIVYLGIRTLAALGPIRRWTAITVRCLVLAVIVLALAGPQWGRTTDDQTVVFAVDNSRSVPEEQQRAANTFVEQAAANMRTGKDRLAVVDFAGRAFIQQLPGDKLMVERTTGPIAAHQTDIASVMRLGLALFPADTARRLVLLSDGNENRELAADEAEAYAALNIPIDVVPLHYEHGAEVLVDQLKAPTAAALGQTIDLRLIVTSQTATSARLTLYRNDQLIDADPASPGTDLDIQLSKGPNRFTIAADMTEPGVHRFQAIVTPENPKADTLITNNDGRAFTIVGEATRVLLVTDAASDLREDDTTSTAALADALRENGIEAEVIPVDALPADAAGLTDCSAVILSNVSAFALGEARQAMLASFVEDQGGGLIAVGGDQSFSVGGYGYTDLEQVLPVETSRDKQKLQSLSQILVIDRSGSMVGEKLAMARDAAVGAIRLLRPMDRIGVIAFDSMPHWIVPLQSAANRGDITRRLSQIGGGGGTVMYPAIDEAMRALRGVDSNLRHMIVLTDGQSTPGAFEDLAKECQASGITISTIAVGDGADEALLEKIASLSGGRMYTASTARPLPQIFARETVLASRSGMYERPFQPQVAPVGNNSILAGIAAADIPPLRGMVITAPKPLAETPLIRITEEGADPVLSYWQAGLGRTVAFTSGLWPRWGPEWVSWSGFGKLWTQAVRYAGRPRNDGDLEVEVTTAAGEGRVFVSAEHLPLRVQASLSVAARVVGPDYETIPLPLECTAAGRFEGKFPLDQPGTYLVVIPYLYHQDGAERRGIVRTGAVVSHSPEYHTLRDNETTLAELARRTGGRILDPTYPASVFEHWSIHPITVQRPIWDQLLRIAMALFLLDVAVRRIAISPADVFARFHAFIDSLAGKRAGADSVATLGSLRGVRKHSTPQEERRPPRKPSKPQPPRRPAKPPAQPEADPLRPVDLDMPDDAPSKLEKPAQDSPKNTGGEGEYTSRLLRAKRRARGDDENNRKA